jgi:hypothetical protein
MSAALKAIASHSSSAEVRQMTLLELVSAVADATEDDGEVVATVLSLLQSGRVRLCGNFRGAGADCFR